jgi:hypothetical protein
MMMCGENICDSEKVHETHLRLVFVVLGAKSRKKYKLFYKRYTHHNKKKEEKKFFFGDDIV